MLAKRMIAVLQENITIQNIGNVLNPLFIKNDVLRASIFGSYARGEQNADSDIDFLVDFADEASLLNMGCLIEDLRDSLGLDVDVITTRSLSKEPKEFRNRVLKDARLIYEIN